MNRNTLMNRLLWSVLLLVLVCALINAALLWREVRSLRTAASRPVEPAHLDDDEFTRIQAFVAAVRANYAAEKEPETSLLLAEDLLNKARYLHGDIGLDEWRRLHLAAEPQLSRLILKRYQAIGEVQQGLSYYEDVLLMPR